MKTNVSQNFSNEFSKKLHLAEFDYYDGNEFITMNIVDINTDSNKITIAKTRLGKISVATFDLMQTLGKKQYYFEYGELIPEAIFISDFAIKKGVYAI